VGVAQFPNAARLAREVDARPIAFVNSTPARSNDCLSIVMVAS
jgi:hypothetical protein